ncbi:hypothetical protein MO867_21695 [Microbulbifer sp. OS29]|uniref:Uncharacterized protein n=1 Tax=Microbulbifer okhotskensis TaxID=2926617 RepID=A0A9X2J8K3_9GAMM|nr:hypothetical protein [Microbulbifer okhotskensis]MCO1336945.1 hypothetical protein [Microbulbifer okhotskensis]
MITFLSESFSKSGFIEFFVIACGMFYVASRISQAKWATPESNVIRIATSWVFWVFACILLIVSLTNIPGCEGPRKQPYTQQNPVPQAESITQDKSKIPNSGEEN